MNILITLFWSLGSSYMIPSLTQWVEGDQTKLLITSQYDFEVGFEKVFIF